MIKLHLLVTFLLTSLYAVEIPTEHAQLQKFGQAVELNAHTMLNLPKGSKKATK